MKHLLSILLALMPFVVVAQKATVESVVLDPMNISASKYPMTDLNGRTAALVIVRVIADNLEFQGNVLDGGVVRKTGEYWVYMSAGTKMLHIHSDRFLPVELYFPSYDIPRLEAAATYIVTLAVPQAAAQPQSAAAGYNYLVLNVSPANAQVTIDGKPTEVQDGGTAKRLLRGGATYAYRVEASGYLPEEGAVAMTGERVERTVALRSTKGTLAVASTTPGTEIYVNGDRMGSGSWTGDLFPGEYLVEGRKAAHRSSDMMVTVTTGQRTSATIPALTALTGTLNVDYSPAGATITVDGKAAGVTPNVLDGILVGSHTVAISSPGYITATLTATVKESDLTTLEGRLEKKVAPAVGSTTPVHLALCATGPDGRAVYITESQWQGLSASARASYKPLGVCLSQGGETFLVELHDKANGEEMNWNAAKTKYNLPTKEQGKVIGENKDALNKALRVFGGQSMNWDEYNFYWTKTEYGSISVWTVYMYNGNVGNHSKTHTFRVRAVAPVPGSSAM